ncbi:MAG: hypothetical protein FuQV1_gp2 [Hangzhou Solinvi-like virus 2]|nr:MAG: hypothetical protein FuQV1_gp2 [Hangzhou Solinvi-like virus 2]
MEVFVKEPPLYTVLNIPGGKPREETAIDFKMYLLFFPNQKYYHIQFKISSESASRFHSQVSSITINIPKVNQLSDWEDEETRTYPAGLRNVVFSDRPQYAVNAGFRGRQSMHIAPVKTLLEAMKNETKEQVVDFYFSDELSVTPIMTVRIDINRKNLDASSIYTSGKKHNPLYATLRFPPQVLILTHIVPGSRGANTYEYDRDQFESNIIVANAGMAAAFIGGGMLQGVGQGVGMYMQAKMQREMQEKYLDWAEDKQQREFLFKRSMQGDMFSYQASQQEKQLDFQKYSQLKNIEFQEEYQRQQHIQQDIYQHRQNEFTKELVEANTDSDIRKARNAQQLAGYRTDAAVSNLSEGVRRGGLGHPLAPIGVSLPPRSASTQTSSPKLNLTQPSGYYTGPSESVI